MKKSMKMLGVAVVSLGLYAGTASAEVDEIDFSGGNTTDIFGVTEIALDGSSFENHFEFTAPSNGPAGANVVSGLIADFDVEFTGFALFDTTDGGPAVSIWDVNLGFFTSLGAELINGHMYDLVVSYDTVGSSSTGSYSGNFSVSPVPEPETYAMLLVGLGLVGYAARRRKRNFN